MDAGSFGGSFQKTYDALILEDSKEAATSLSAVLKQCSFPFDLRVRWANPRTFCTSGSSGLSSEQGSASLLLHPHILLADIDFGEGQQNGIEFIKSHYPQGSATQVIYVTGYVEYCTAVYQTEHVSFLLKPVQQADLDFAINKAVERIEESKRDVLPVREDGTTHMIATKDIDYIESRRRKIVIHCGSQAIETYSKLSDIASSLPPYFLRCHQSFLVNMNCIVGLSPDCILLGCGQRVPVSQSRRQQVNDTVAAFYAPHKR